MKLFKITLLILGIVIAVKIVIFLFSPFDLRETRSYYQESLHSAIVEEASTVNCKSSEITLESVKTLPGGEQFDAETVRQVNEETPYCRDLCLQQLEYSKKYNDWFAEKDLRKTCADLGIPLPLK